MTATYLTCAETAKLVREALKRHRPKVKFSVRSKTYSGGASIDIHWTDGPRTKAVDAVAKRFEGADFDGMQDLKSTHCTVLSQPDGSVQEVRFGADFIFTSRSESDRATAHPKALALIRERLTLRDGLWGNDDPEYLAHRILRDRDYLTEPDLEPAFNRVALHKGE